MTRIVVKSLPENTRPVKQRTLLISGVFRQRANSGSRTHDLTITNRLLYQLSYVGNGWNYTSTSPELARVGRSFLTRDKRVDPMVLGEECA